MRPWGLIYARKAQELTQKDLGEILGVSHNMISRWERGKAIAPPELKKACSLIFRQSVPRLFALSEHPLGLTVSKIQEFEIPSEAKEYVLRYQKTRCPGKGNSFESDMAKVSYLAAKRLARDKANGVLLLA